MTDVIVTGLPRSGSTLVSALIDGLPNAVSLNAPVTHQGLLAKHPLDALPFCKWLNGDFALTRKQLLAEEPVMDFRAADGTPLTDGMFDALRKLNDKGEAEPVSFTRPGLTEDFILAMRDTTSYTSLLPTLVSSFKDFKIIAVIRHPFDVLLAWRKLPQPLIGRGRPHGIARFWPEALAIAETKMDATEQMVQLYDAYLARYHAVREHINIVKYEDIVDDPMILSGLLGTEKLSAFACLIEKRQRVLITSEINVLRTALKKYGTFTRQYYTDI